MTFFKSLLVALSTYSVIPVPQFEWNDRNMKYAICFFPVVGIVCGGVLLAWYGLCNALAVRSFFFGVVAVCVPLFITGGIHMDGYMDTIDALASHQPIERKLEILKDSNCGAFAVVYYGVYLLLSLGLFYELYEAHCIVVLCPIFVLSRAMSAFCAVNMPNARKSGMLCAYTKNADKKKATVAMTTVAVLSCSGIVLLSPIVGGCTVLLGAISVLVYYKMAMKQFGGVTGDTSGFFLQICELSCLFGAWIGAFLV